MTDILKETRENTFIVTRVKEKLIASMNIDQEWVERSVPSWFIKKKKKKEEKSGVLAEMLLCCTLKNERAKKNFKLKVLCKDIFEF